MRRVRIAALAAAVMAACLVPAAGASAATVQELRGPKATWMTGKIRDRIRATGERGVSFATIRRWVRADQRRKGKPEEDPPNPCGSADPSPADAHAGACMVAPAGCTMNFIFKKGGGTAAAVSDGRSYFLGTAGHCVDHSRQEVFVSNMGRVVAIGTVEKHIDGGIGNDYAIVQLYRGMDMDPRNPSGGPKEIYTGCEPQFVKYWGHGFEVAVGPGKPNGGPAPGWYDRAFTWVGFPFGGDSGSGATIQDDLAAGDVTHLVVDPRYEGVGAGTRVTRALTWMGGLYHLVNEDFTTSRATMEDTQCGNADAGSGDGGSVSAGGLLSDILG